jgi:hypothetical protein
LERFRKGSFTMSSSTRWRKIVVLLLGAAFVASAAAAADLRKPAVPGPVEIFSQAAQTLLGRLAGLVSSLWDKEGAGADPYGVPGNGKAGAGLDPYGNPGNQKAGPGMDPYGARSSDKEGSSLDPYGLCVNGQCSGGPQQVPSPEGPGLDPYGL